ncbi:MAG: hypothetical protein K6G91_01305 [Kiritimatiellae bacterium]|nr:hypothetical protein [Kiritimatiellia bacterium]
MKTRFRTILVASLSLAVGAVRANTWTNGVWSDGAPGDGQDLTISLEGDSAVTLETAVSAANVTVEGNGTLTLDGAMLVVNGAFTANADVVATSSTLSFGDATIGAGHVLAYDTGSDAMNQAGLISGAGTFRKSGTGAFWMSKGAKSNYILDGGVTVDIQAGTFYFDGRVQDAAMGTATFVLGADGTSGLDNVGWFAVDGTMTISNETDKVVLTNNNGANQSRYMGTSLVKGGAGTLTFASTLNYDTMSVAIQGGTLLLFVKQGNSYTYWGPITGGGRFGKTGAGSLAIGAGSAMTFDGGLVCDDGELLLLPNNYYARGVYGTGKVMLTTECELHLGIGSDGLSVGGATIAATNETAIIRIGSRTKYVECEESGNGGEANWEGGVVSNGVFALNGGRLHAWGWPKIVPNASMTVSNDVASVYESNNIYNTLYCDDGAATFVKKGSGLLTLDESLAVTDIDIQDGSLTLSTGRVFKVNCTTIAGDGGLEFDHEMNVAATNLTVRNLLLRDGVSFTGEDFAVSGVLKPLSTLDSLEKRFAMADGSGIDVSELAAPAFANGRVSLDVASGATVRVMIGSRTDCVGQVGRQTCLLGYAAKPAGDFQLVGDNVGHWYARKAPGGVFAAAAGLVFIVR